MKAGIILLLFVSFLVSSSFAQSAKKKPLRYFPASSIVGKWVKYSTESDERIQISKDEVITHSETLCNVCLEIDFKADSTGTVKPHGSDKVPVESFWWGRRGNLIVIRNLPEKEGDYSSFDSGQYTIGARAEDTVVLTDKKGVRYILTRSSE